MIVQGRVNSVQNSVLLHLLYIMNSQAEVYPKQINKKRTDKAAVDFVKSKWHDFYVRDPYPFIQSLILQRCLKTYPTDPNE
jgi:hypothetical protein